MLMVLAWQAVEGQRLDDVLFDPARKLWIFARPFGEPGSQIAARLGEIAPVIEPTQFLQAVIVDATRHVVERISQKMHVTALIGRFRQDLAQCRPEPGVIIGDHELDATETARLEPGKKIPPARPALTIGELDRQDLAAAVPVDADRDQNCLADDYPALAHPFIAGVEDQIGKGFGQGTAGKLRQTGIQSLVDRTDRRGRKAVARNGPSGRTKKL